MSQNKEVLARAAKRIVNDIAFDEVLRYLQVSAYDEFLASDPDRQDAREQIYLKVRALNDIRATLRNLAQEADKKEA